MKNNPFSGKIFVQGLRLLRLPGLIMAAAALGLTLLQTLTVLSQYLNTPKYSEAAVAVGSIYYTASFSASLFGALAPFILTLSVFSFLRKRRASDFYHSIPVTRVCLFLMYSLAVAAWSFLIILLPLIFNTAVFAIAGMPYSLPIFTSQLASLAALLVGALKVIGATALIMSITGNLFGNISMTAILLYVPVIVRNIYTAALSQVTGGIAFSNANTLTTGMTSFYYPLYYYLFAREKICW